MKTIDLFKEQVRDKTIISLSVRCYCVDGENNLKKTENAFRKACILNYIT